MDTDTKINSILEFISIFVLILCGYKLDTNNMGINMDIIWIVKLYELPDERCYHRECKLN